MVVVQGWGRGNGVLSFNGYSVLQNGKLLEICCTTMRIQLALISYIHVKAVKEANFMFVFTTIFKKGQ